MTDYNTQCLNEYERKVVEYDCAWEECHKKVQEMWKDGSISEYLQDFYIDEECINNLVWIFNKSLAGEIRHRDLMEGLSSFTNSVVNILMEERGYEV